MLVILSLALLHRLGLRKPAQRNQWLRSLLVADFVGDITGGDSFSDIYGFRRFLEGSLPLLSAVLLDVPYAMLPQTFGPFRSRVSRLLAGMLLRRATTILTRDRNCGALVERLCGRPPRFCPDVAFALEPQKPSQLLFAPSELTLSNDELVIGVNVSGLLYMGGYTRDNMFGLRSEYRDLINRLVDRLLSSTSAKLLLISHVFGTEYEEEAALSLLQSAGSRYPGRVFTLSEALTEREIKWVIGQAHFFIGSRMHACIAALSQCVPAVGLAYSDKFLGVFESAGVGDAVIDLRTTSPSQVIEKTMTALESRHKHYQRLKSVIPTVHARIFQIFGELFEGTDAERTTRLKRLKCAEATTLHSVGQA